MKKINLILVNQRQKYLLLISKATLFILVPFASAYLCEISFS